MERRFNEVARDQPNLLVKWRVRYMKNLDITNLRGNDQSVCYIEVKVNDWFVTQNTIVPMPSCWLKGSCLFTIWIKGFADCVSVQHLSSVACWHCNLLYCGIFYVLAFGLCLLYRGICFIEVLFHTFYCNFGQDVEYCSLYQGPC